MGCNLGYFVQVGDEKLCSFNVVVPANRKRVRGKA